MSENTIPAAAPCSACERSRQVGYSRGYVAGMKKNADEIKGQFVLLLREGGRIIIRGTTEIDERELERIQGWMAQQLIIRKNRPTLSCEPPNGRFNIDVEAMKAGLKEDGRADRELLEQNSSIEPTEGSDNTPG